MFGPVRITSWDAVPSGAIVRHEGVGGVRRSTTAARVGHHQLVAVWTCGLM